jgi:hypothetical protein
MRWRQAHRRSTGKVVYIVVGALLVSVAVTTALLVLRHYV